MSIDISGQNPKNEKGKIFSSNLLWWPLLWAYTQASVYPDIALDSDAIWDEELARKVAAALRKGIKEGRAAAYEESLAYQKSLLPERTCPGCQGPGTRIENGTSGTCTHCQDFASAKNICMLTSFSRDYVEMFAEFLENCGGCRID